MKWNLSPALRSGRSFADRPLKDDERRGISVQGMTTETRLPGTKQVSILMHRVLLKAPDGEAGCKEQSQEKESFTRQLDERKKQVTRSKSVAAHRKLSISDSPQQTSSHWGASKQTFFNFSNKRRKISLWKCFRWNFVGAMGAGKGITHRLCGAGYIGLEFKDSRVKHLQIQHWVMQMMRLAQGITCSHLERLEII